MRIKICEWIGRGCMKQYRSRDEIIAHILETARGQKVRHTEILQKASLSHILFKQYCSFNSKWTIRVLSKRKEMQDNR